MPSFLSSVGKSMWKSAFVCVSSLTVATAHLYTFFFNRQEGDGEAATVVGDTDERQLVLHLDHGESISFIVFSCSIIIRTTYL